MFCFGIACLLTKGGYLFQNSLLRILLSFYAPKSKFPPQPAGCPVHFLVINGPNLAHTGKREPLLYGSVPMEALPALMDSYFTHNAPRFTFFQSNHEGALIDYIEHTWQENQTPTASHTDGIIINAGALTHTSLALADCLGWVKIPFVEVHISHVMARAETEPIRGQSFLARYSLGLISGFGLHSYALAALALAQHLSPAS